MPDTSTEPATDAPLAPADAAVDGSRPRHPAPTGWLRVPVIVATIGVLTTLLGIALLARPVETPVQDCGSALMFLLDGRVSVGADPANPPKGVTEAEVQDNNERPCHTRVGDAAKVPAIMIGGGLLAAILAAVVEIVIRSWAWASRRHAPVDNEPGTSDDPSADGDEGSLP